MSEVVKLRALAVGDPYPVEVYKEACAAAADTIEAIDDCGYWLTPEEAGEPFASLEPAGLVEEETKP